MIRLVDNLVELVSLIKLIKGLLKSIYKTRGSVILNQPINLSTKQSTILNGYNLIN